MHVTDHVDIPDEVLNALEAGQLVVFAGAGVSMGAPSNLPDFDGLAEQIAAGSLARREAEPIDRFLGRLERNGVQVHKRAAAILSPSGSEPTRLHHAVASLFAFPDRLRVVTTNFDGHFPTAVSSALDGLGDVYYAPALPLGQSFTGLVYLHGAIERDADGMVLTDSDFGRAYLTEAWATRFLQAMFANHTVLFMGYSHDDPVMTYLARALVPGTSRYALTPPGKHDHWEFLGITPITYPLVDGSDRHEALCEAVEAWARQARMGTLDQEARIAEIVSSVPPLSPQDDDYLKRALTDVVTTRFFAKHASGVEWLDWVENHPSFVCLFDERAHVGDVPATLACWFAQKFVCDHSERALELVQQRDQRLSPALWSAIAMGLSRGDPRPDPQKLAKWVAVLLSSKPLRLGAGSVDWMLSNCQYPEDKGTALLLFEHLSRPTIRMRPSFLRQLGEPNGEHLVHAEIALDGDEHWLGEAWGKFFLPNLADLANELASIVTGHLQRAHLLMQAFGLADDQHDPMSLTRSAVEPHEQDSHPDEGSILIDAARDIIEYMVKHTPESARAVIRSWRRAPVPILRRLAVHGLAESRDVGADAKIAAVLDNGWLYELSLTHEVSRLLGIAYPSSSHSVRQRLLGAVARGPDDPATEDIDRESRAYEVFNVLVWLSRADPDCELVNQKLAQMQEAHPKFEERTHPDFSSWTSVGFRGPQSPVSVTELLGKTPGDPGFIDWLLSYRGESLDGPDRSGLLAILSQTVASDFGWGEQLAQALTSNKEWKVDVWRSMLRGWRQAELTESQYAQVVGIVRCLPTLEAFAYEVTDLLQHFAGERLADATLASSEALAATLYDRCVEAPDPRVKERSDRWLTEAINHPGGMLAQFWLAAISLRRRSSGDDWQGIPADYVCVLDKVLLGSSFTAAMGRVVLAGRLQFFYAVDSEWTLDKLVPLLDWSPDSLRAQQAWHGHLTIGRLNEPLLGALMPRYVATFPVLDAQLSPKREKFCGHLASIALFSSRSPVSGGWVNEFLKSVGEESRTTWANRLGAQLGTLDATAAQEAWDNWLSDYWQQRNEGVPVPLSAGEKEYMVQWPLALEPVFEAAVDRVCGMPLPPPGDTRLYYDLAQTKLADTHPAGVARLLDHLLPYATQPFYAKKQLQQTARAIVGGDVPTPLLLRICDHLGGLDCPEAAELSRLTKEKGSGSTD